MPKLSINPKHGFRTEGESLTEQEHKDSCDINLMISRAARGQDIRGSSSPDRYGYDDTTLDGVQFRIQKAELERSLSETANAHTFTEEELKHIPKSVREKFKFKSSPKSEPKNDDKTTKKGFTPDSSQNSVLPPSPKSEVPSSKADAE